MPTKTVEFYKELLDSVIREKILAYYSEAGLYIKRAIEGEKTPLFYLICTKARKHITDYIIADAIRTVMRAYYDENKGGLFRAATRHAELALEISTISSLYYCGRAKASGFSGARQG